jgi:hypothetical protein
MPYKRVRILTEFLSSLCRLTPLTSASVLHLTLKLLSPLFTEMSLCSTPETDAADGPLLRYWTNSLT